MSISMYTVSVPVFIRTLEALAHNLEKARSHFTAKKVDASVALGLRIIADMQPLSFQVRTACDFAKNTIARLSGVALVKFEDNETSFEELMQRIERTLEFVRSADRAAIDSAAQRDIEFPVGPKKLSMRGDDYLVHFALPNFHFHATMAFAILRQAGVGIGKVDFLGKVPGFEALMAA